MRRTYQKPHVKNKAAVTRIHATAGAGINFRGNIGKYCLIRDYDESGGAVILESPPRLCY